MAWLKAFLLAAAVTFLIAPASAQDAPAVGTFLVRNHGTVLLDQRGEEIKRLESKANSTAAFSPDGQLVVFPRPGKLAIQSLTRPDEETIVPLQWGTTGSSLGTIWSSDSKRLLICEQGYHKILGIRTSLYRVYDLATKDQVELDVPSNCWVSDWSADGKRLLTTARSLDGNPRVAWVNADGSGELDYVTSEEEVVYGAIWSPDEKSILCMAAPKPQNGERARARLCVINLSTNHRTIVDKPGETHGYCWSPDGSKIAYTWQQSLDNPAEVEVREAFLITCSADGSDPMTITSRKHGVPPNNSGRNGIVIFFEILDWR